MSPVIRKTLLGLATVLGTKPMGFFIPYRHAASAVPEGYPVIAELLHGCEQQFAESIRTIDTYADDLMRIAEQPDKARFTQDWFPRLDAANAYAMVRQGQPKRIVEVGSGHSTRFMARAVADGQFDTTILCIDPQPRAKLEGTGVEHRPTLLQQAGSEPFDALQPGDILFIDSSHIAMPGTDVDRLFLDILPCLTSGVLVHVHDIFLPDAYPSDWTWRGYNEQMLVGALLTAGGYDCLFASHYVVTRMPEALEKSVIGRLPLVAGARETSLWLRKR